MLPWDGVGTDVSMCDSLADAMTEAGVLFNTEVVPGLFQPEEKGPAYRAEGYFYVIRTDINAVLGACKTKFAPLQNDIAFSFLSPLIENGVCEIDTIGSFNKGAKVWALCKLTSNSFNITEEDELQFYLLLINAHDGSTSVTAGIVPIRIVCANMFHMLNKKGLDLIKFKHTGDPEEKLAEATDTLLRQINHAGQFIDQLRKMAQVPVSPDELNMYLREVFNLPLETSTKAENKIKRLKELFVHGKGNFQMAVRGSWYAAYNAVSEYLNYEAGRSVETRLNSLWFGANSGINRKAFDLALKSVLEKE